MANLFTQQQQTILFIEIFNADVLIREDITVDQFIDVVLGNRKYLTCVYVSVDLHKRGQTYVEE
jgi:ribosome-interacting GTPase 1